MLVVGDFLARNISHHAPERALSAANPPFLAESAAITPSVLKKRLREPAGMVSIVRGPRPVTQTRLDYTPDALRAGVSCLVEMQFTIAEDGSVQKPLILSGHPLLAQGVAEAVSQGTFMRVNRRPSPRTTEMAIQSIS